MDTSSSKRPLREWARLFLVYVGAVMRHTTSLLLGFIGGGIVALPAWIKPLLSPSNQVALQRMMDRLGGPATYRHLAEGLVLIGFVLAGFLAYDEERTARESQAADLATAVADRPRFVAELREPLVNGDHNNLDFDIHFYPSDSTKFGIGKCRGSMGSRNPNAITAALYLDCIGVE